MTEHGIQKIVIAIDGPAGAGKSTLAGSIARELGFFLLDTGALYRAMALFLTRKNIKPGLNNVPPEILHDFDVKICPTAEVMRLKMGDQDITSIIRDEKIGVAASKFSAKPEIRQKLFKYQRLAAIKWNIVAEGRDMGTVVFPEARIKFFLTAGLEERSKRRYLELSQKGMNASFENVLNEMRARDERDAARETAPLIKASDAVEIDNTNIGPNELLDMMLEIIRERLS